MRTIMPLYVEDEFPETKQWRARLAAVDPSAGYALICPSCLWRGLDSKTWARGHERCPSCGSQCRREKELAGPERDSYAKRLAAVDTAKPAGDAPDPASATRWTDEEIRTEAQILYADHIFEWGDTEERELAIVAEIERCLRQCRDDAADAEELALMRALFEKVDGHGFAVQADVFEAKMAIRVHRAKAGAK
jgi:hypothetical protein